MPGTRSLLAVAPACTASGVTDLVLQLDDRPIDLLETLVVTEVA